MPKIEMIEIVMNLRLSPNDTLGTLGIMELIKIE